MGTAAGVGRRSRPLHAFGSLAGNRALLRVLVAYLMFTEPLMPSLSVRGAGSG
jgi:hypothetical protein